VVESQTAQSVKRLKPRGSDERLPAIRPAQAGLPTCLPSCYWRERRRNVLDCELSSSRASFPASRATAAAMPCHLFSRSQARADGGGPTNLFRAGSNTAQDFAAPAPFSPTAAQKSGITHRQLPLRCLGSSEVGPGWKQPRGRCTWFQGAQESLPRSPRRGVGR
jgi:hypothetical protein